MLRCGDGDGVVEKMVHHITLAGLLREETPAKRVVVDIRSVLKP